MSSKLDGFEADVRGFVNLGLTDTEIGRRFGVSREVVTRFRNRHKIERAATPIVLDDGPSELEIVTQERDELRSALNATRKQSVREERITASLEDAIATVKPPPRVTKIAARKTDKAPRHRHLLVLSDWHGGERVERSEVDGLNSYSWDIMCDRVGEVVDATLSHKEHSPSLTGLDVLLVGDMCSGSNHEELAVTNEFPLAEQGVKVGYLIAETIEKLAPHYRNVRVGSVVGNHPRLVRKPAAKNVHDNMDWVASIVAKEYLKAHKNIDFTVGSHSLFWEIAGRTLYVFHGDGIRSTMPGVPWGGVMRRVNELRRSSRAIDGFVLGHFHQANVMADLGIFMNGALKGVDGWVRKNLGAGSPPAQLLLEFDEKRSRLTAAKMITPTAGL